MSKLLALLAVFRHGATVADPASWKRAGIAAEALSGLLLALAVFAPESYRALLTPESAQAIAAGIAAAVQLLLAPAVAVATTDKLGLPPRPAGQVEPQPAPADPAPQPQRHPAADSPRTIHVPPAHLDPGPFDDIYRG